MIGVLAGIIMNFWFTTVGGTGIFYELANPGSISEVLNENGIPAAMISITQQLPMSFLFSVLFLIVTIVFVLTTTDSMSYTMAITLTGDEDPPRALRYFGPHYGSNQHHFDLIWRRNDSCFAIVYRCNSHTGLHFDAYQSMDSTEILSPNCD